MKILSTLLASILLVSISYSQNVNYVVEIVQLFADGNGACGLDDGFGADEEVTWHVWAMDNATISSWTNQTTMPNGDCYGKDANVPITLTTSNPELSDPLLLKVNNTAATSISIMLEAWEDDNISNAVGSVDRCSFNSGDDCHTSSTLDISFRNDPMCSFKSYTLPSGDFSITVRIKWEYTQFDAGPTTMNGCGTEAYLQGQGSGQWTITSGTGGSFSDDLDPLATFYGNQGETYVLGWAQPAGCIAPLSSDQVTVTMLDKPLPNLQLTSAACEGEDVTFTASNGATYQWALGSISNPIDTTTSGAYTFTNLTSADMPVIVTAVDANGCFGTEAISSALNDVPIIDLGDDDTTCPGVAILINGTDQNPTPGYNFTSYSWNIGGTSPNLLASNQGQYIVVISTEDGCTASDTISIFKYTSPSINIGSDFSFCLGDTVVLDAGAGFVSYNWSSGATTQTDTITNFGTVSVTVSDTNTCTKTSSINVTPEYNYIQLQADTTIFLGTSIDLTAPNGAGYSWSTADTSQVITVTPDESTNYEVTVLQIDGCYTVADINVLIGEGNNIFIPTMFSPNGDLSNDNLLVYGNGIETITLRIFNRWGDLVFESSDLMEIQTNGWDGKHNEIDQPTGTYVWTIEGTDMSGIPIDFQGKKSGTILLRR